jgi:hypothetical protein
MGGDHGPQGAGVDDVDLRDWLDPRKRIGFLSNKASLLAVEVSLLAVESDVPSSGRFPQDGLATRIADLQSKRRSGNQPSYRVVTVQFSTQFRKGVIEKPQKTSGAEGSRTLDLCIAN